MSNTSGGGGGGGYFGGGGGGGGGKSGVHQAGGGGGGGGSCYALAVTACGTASGAPEVVLSYLADLTPPAISIATPAAQAVYPVGAHVVASYACADQAGGSGLAECQGPVASGSAIDTAAPGPHAFVVSAVDNAGNASSRTVDYTVAAAPSISIVSPARGHKYKPGQRVHARYTCHDGAYGPGIKSCTGTVGKGELIDTMSLKRVKFTVTAISRDGQKATKTVTYSVAPPEVVSAPRLIVSTADGKSQWAFTRLVSISPAATCQPRPLHLRCPKQTAPSIILSSPLTNDKTLLLWRSAAMRGDPTGQKTIKITVYAPGGRSAPKAVAVYTLTEAWPTKITITGRRSGSKDTATVTVTFRGNSLISDVTPSG
jgi:hypothetical protein